MKLLLRETVDQLGTIGDIVNVPDGYGRNFLLPRGIALAVTPENIRRLDSKKQELLAAEDARRGEAVQLGEKVKAKQLTIMAKAASDEGKLYGSVSGLTVAEAFVKEGLPIEARMILLDHPIKELGVFDVRVRLFPGVEVEAKVWIVEESAGQAGATAPKGEREERGPKGEGKPGGHEGEGERPRPKRKAPVEDQPKVLSLVANENEDNDAILNAKLKPTTKKERKDDKKRRGGGRRE